MRFDVHHHHHVSGVEQLLQKLDSLISRGELIMSTQQDAIAQLDAITANLAKVGTETQTLLDEIALLQKQATDQGGVSSQLQAAIDRVANQAKVVDDLVPDAPAGDSTDTPVDGGDAASQDDLPRRDTIPADDSATS